MDKKKSEIIKELKKFKVKNHISKIIFFGSRAKKKHGKNSDVALIVVSPQFKGVKSFKRAPTIRLKLNLDHPVDMLCYTPREFDEKKGEPTIVREAIKDGIEI